MTQEPLAGLIFFEVTAPVALSRIRAEMGEHTFPVAVTQHLEDVLATKSYYQLTMD